MGCENVDEGGRERVNVMHEHVYLEREAELEAPERSHIDDIQTRRDNVFRPKSEEMPRRVAVPIRC